MPEQSTLSEIRLLLAEREKYTQAVRLIDDKIASLAGFLPVEKSRKAKKNTLSNVGFKAACNNIGARP